MLRPAGEYRFHSLQVWDVEFSWGVVCFKAINTNDAYLDNEISAEGDQVAGHFSVATNATGVNIKNVEPKM